MNNDQKFDPVNKPSHYADTSIEPIQVIEDWGLGFCLGNAIKYIKRAGHKKSSSLDDKSKEIQDLNKAIWYLQRRILELDNNLTNT